MLKSKKIIFHKKNEKKNIYKTNNDLKEASSNTMKPRIKMENFHQHKRFFLFNIWLKEAELKK